ncbi:MAG: TIGR03016 family PEP-CTERM system-associated outer membrane protein, partial [Nitrospirota bacterium]
MKKIIYSGLSAVFLLLTFVSSAAAKLDVNASVGLREEYNDNIFLTKTNREDDFITSISPNIRLNYALSNLDLSLNYGLNFKFFAHHSERNLTSLSSTQAASLEHQFRPMKGMFIDISDVYRRVPVDARNQVAFDNVFVNMTDSNVFSVSPNFVYPLSSTVETRFGYRYTNIWYKVGEGNNSESNSAFISILKKLSPSLSTGVNYNFVAVQPKKTEAYDQHQGSVSVMYQRGSDFKVWGEFGRVFLNYESSRKIETNFWDIGSNYSLKISESTSLGAGYSTSFSETDITGEVRQLRFGS